MKDGISGKTLVLTYSINTINTTLSGTLLNTPIFPATIAHLCIDSRKIVYPTQSLFFALKGPRHNGHRFLEHAYQNGIRNFVVSEKIKLKVFPAANFILVDDSLAALQLLATHHRAQFDLLTIGITGSNGKTIVKEWLYQLLHPFRHIVRSPKSYNSQVGVPLSVWGIQTNHDLGLFEAGISQVGEMENLARMIQCNIGLFTNIGPAHNAGFADMPQKIKEKALLFQGADWVVCCKDHKAIYTTLQALGHRVFCWSYEKGAEIWVKAINTAAGQTQLLLEYDKEEIVLNIPFSDQASIENILHCCALLLHLNFSPNLIAERLKQLEPIAMRLAIKSGVRDCILIDDSYNNDLASLSIALNVLQHQHESARKTLILSDILQSGQSDRQLYQSVAKLVQEYDIQHFIGIGEHISYIQETLTPSVQQHYFQDTSAYLESDLPNQHHNEVLLIKGARPFAFEKIVHRLSNRTHSTVLTVNLSALQHNLSVFAQYLSPQTKIIAMVKASAYGAGSIEVARALEFLKIDYLAVAYADEGRELRMAGIQTPIFVLNVEPGTFDLLAQYQLEPEIYRLTLLQKLAAYVKAQNVTIPIHLKIETGMNRLGFLSEELDEVLALLKATPQLKVQSVFSHLAASEAEEQDAFSHQQVRRFMKNYSTISNVLGYQPARHILNSAGIIRFPDYHMDFVRLGIGLYGIDTSGHIQNELEEIMTLTASISQIKYLKAGDTVGYGRLGKVQSDKRVATISLGYADGLLRQAGNGAFSVMIHGKPAPIIGNVCMDMTMVDLTEIPEAKEGDEVLLFGPTYSVNHLAQSLGTIPYEVYCGLSPRIRRVYVYE